MRRSRSGQDAGVSEILGVTMLLAMVVTVIGGVFVLIGPFLSDIDDNREWSAGSVAATQLNDRILTAAQSPEGTGLVQQNAQISRSMDPLRDAETWTVMADLAGHDRTRVTLDGDIIAVTSQNRTAANVQVSSDNGTASFNLTNGEGNHTFNNLRGLVTIEVYDIHERLVHKFVRCDLDGVRLNNALTDGAFTVDLVNGARIEKLPSDAIDVRTFPRLKHDTLLDGTPRVSLVLLDIDIDSSASRRSATINIDSIGQTTLYDSTARNLVIEVEVGGDESIEPQYIHHWSGDYKLFLAGGSLNEYEGFGPYARLSGLDGLTLYPTDSPLELHIELQQVVIG